MAGKGPPPKDPSTRRRTNPTPGFKLLPHDGRKGPIPKWPLPKASRDELKVWRDLWKMPQAVEWERLQYLRIVARCVRLTLLVEVPPIDPKLLNEVRQLEDRLGLTSRAMLGLRWETDEPAPEAEPAGNAPPARRLVVAE